MRLMMRQQVMKKSTKNQKHKNVFAVLVLCSVAGFLLPSQILLGGEQASVGPWYLPVYYYNSIFISDEPIDAALQVGSSVPPVYKYQYQYQYSEITFTNVGWFHPSPEIANTTSRCMVARRFMDAVEQHERFNRSMWTDLERSPDATRPVLAFLDYDVCNTVHWPKFGGDKYTNADMEHGRPAGNSNKNGDPCSKIDQALQSPAMAAPESRLLVLSCNAATNYNAPKLQHLRCLFRNRNAAKYEKLVVGHLDARYDSIHATQDFGLPPSPVKTVHMSTENIRALKDCQQLLDRQEDQQLDRQEDQQRPIEISFKGRARIPFPGFHEYFRPLNDGHRRKIHFGWEHYVESPLKNTINGKILEPASKEKQASESYYAWILNTTFCPTPRGDNLYSVRFSEVMSAACIPIVYADGWVLPYNQDIVPDWNQLAVLIPQRNVSSTLDVIARITKEERCQMQNRVFDFYNKYVKDSNGRLRAILEMMDARLLANKEGRDHGRINYAPE